MNGFALQNEGSMCKNTQCKQVNMLTVNVLTLEFFAKIYNKAKFRFLFTSFLKKRYFFSWYIFVINIIKTYVSKKEKNGSLREVEGKNWGVNC